MAEIKTALRENTIRTSYYCRIKQKPEEMTVLFSPLSNMHLAIPFLFAKNFNVRSSFIKEVQISFLKESF